jgi:signal transduction histidine kinase/ActR/RegA family two-component response regulator
MVGLELAVSAYPMWLPAAAATVGLFASALWFTRPPQDARSGETGGQDDAARLRELQAAMAELTRSRAAALEAVERTQESLATISHELRSPLNAILGWTQILEPRVDLASDVVEALRVIRRNALRQRQLLDDLVDLSRVMSGALRLDPRPMRIQDALEEACQAVQAEMTRRRITLECPVDAEAMVHGDPRRLQQVLWNLLANAIRFTPDGGEVSVRSDVTETEVTITVADSGSGIDPDFLPHVFEPFRQQPGAARGPATLGLGLALVRVIVAGHGGRVAAHSDGPGRGAAFSVTLPRLAAAAMEPAGSEVPPARDTPLAGLRVLAVDDEPDWRELLGHILTAAGAEARIAGSAAEALRIFAEWRPDVLLSDIAMPGTDGYGLIASIQARAEGATIPAAAMTAHAGQQDRARTARAGFAEHLVKPVAPQELIDAVRRLVDRSPRKARGAGAG